MEQKFPKSIIKYSKIINYIDETVLGIEPKTFSLQVKCSTTKLNCLFAVIVFTLLHIITIFYL